MSAFGGLRRLVCALLLGLAVLAVGAGGASAAPAKTLVLYDTTGPYGWLGELYGIGAANLAGHFGTQVAKPVSTYRAGDMKGYTATVYLGSTYDEPLPTSFLDDVLTATKPVIWVRDNIWQLTARAATFSATYGWTWRGYDASPVSEVRYKGTSLTRSLLNSGAGIMDVLVTDATKATVLANAVRSDGSEFPWAIRSGNLTYVGEIPFSYVNETDRSMIFSDLLFDALAPETPSRHRAMVRIEDVGPDADPAQLRRIADYLKSRNVPFSVATYPLYKDPLGVEHGGVDTTITLKQRPQVVSALKYMQARGGTILMHGYTHQYGKIANPYDGQSANDFEFYRAHVDENDSVIYDGPVPGDSQAWASGRITSAAAAFATAGLAVPQIFEFPHYAGSAADYAAVKAHPLIRGRYERGLYFSGVLRGGQIDYTRLFGQFFPYPVTDVFGSKVLPENLGNYEPEAFNNHPPRLPAQVVDAARRNLVVRDGFASFFYHPYLADACPVPKGSTPCIDDLKTIVEGIQGLGYTFVAPSTLL